MSDELRPCPFCGEDATLMVKYEDVMFVECNNVDCEHRGPVGTSERMAEDLWNHRPVEDELRAKIESLHRQIDNAAPVAGEGVSAVVDEVPMYGGPVLLRGPLSMQRREDGIVELSQYEYDEESERFDFTTIGYVFDDETLGDQIEELETENQRLREALEPFDPTEAEAERLGQCSPDDPIETLATPRQLLAVRAAIEETKR